MIDPKQVRKDTLDKNFPYYRHDFWYNFARVLIEFIIIVIGTPFIFLKFGLKIINKKNRNALRKAIKKKEGLITIANHIYDEDYVTIRRAIMPRMGYVSMWSADSVPHGLRVIVTDVATGTLLYASPFYSALPGDSVVEVADGTDLQFAKYFTGSFRVASAIESNGKFHSIVEYNANNLQQDYVMGLQYVSAPGSRLNGWSDSYTRMSNYGLPGFTMGDCSMTISDLATGDSSISVGSYTSRSFAPVLSGHNTAVAGGTVGDISSFSSFGPDMRHVSRPEIVAPGQCVVSSYSRYDSTMAVNNNWLTAIAQAGGVSYPYGVDVGTSMSAPLVSGAIALMLQADARLGVDQVKRILKHTARRDHWVTGGDPERW